MVSKVQRQREVDSVSCLMSGARNRSALIGGTQTPACIIRQRWLFNVISCLDVQGFKHGYKDLALDSEFDVQPA